MDNAKTIDALNSLVIINNDRVEGYKTATEEAKETDLKMLFSDLMQTSIEARKELVNHVTKLGGTPDEGTRVTGKFFRVWMDMKAALTGSDRKTILDSCVFGEQVALDAYKTVLTDHHEHLSSEEQQILNKHHGLLKADHDKVEQLRDLMKEEKKLMD